MSNIKKLFDKFTKKQNYGPGRKLNSNQPSTSSNKPKKDGEVYVPPKRKNNELSSEARAAAAAAMARIEQKQTSKEFNTSLAAIKAQVRRELEAEKKAAQSSETASTSVVPVQQKPKTETEFVVKGVFYRCPIISDEILPKTDWRVKIREFLYEQLKEEPGLTSCLIIHNCNTKDKVEVCIETLTKYLENIVNHPDEDKYHKIRMSNRIFCEKVKNCEGSLEFLKAAGFTQKEIDGEDFLIWDRKNIESLDQLSILLDGLLCAETISLELDRNIQILLSSQVRKFENLPPDFYRISPEEIKREQELRTSAIESAQILKTKAMREKEELHVANQYRYTLIRIRFPNGIYLQGTFSIFEKLSNVYEFVLSCLKDESLEFFLIGPNGQKFSDEEMEKSLRDLLLVPNVLLTFQIANHDQLTKQSESEPGDYIKEEFMMLIQYM